MSELRIKQGDTFEFSGQLVDASEDPVDLTGFTIRSQVRDAVGTLIEELTLELGEDTGAYSFSATPEQTQEWPTKRLLCDVQFTYPDDTVLSTDTFAILVLRDVTA